VKSEKWKDYLGRNQNGRQQPISCPRRKRNGLVKITIVFNREVEDVMMG
jgi:hypothetical protein